MAIEGKRDLKAEELFVLAEALDEYEVEKEVEEMIVIDISEITSSGMIVVHVIPKRMLSYNEIYQHVDTLIKDALKKSGLKSHDYEIKKIIFRTIRPGTPSSVVDLQALRSKVDRLWDNEFGDTARSYA